MIWYKNTPHQGMNKDSNYTLYFIFSSYTQNVSGFYQAKEECTVDSLNEGHLLLRTLASTCSA